MTANERKLLDRLTEWNRLKDRRDAALTQAQLEDDTGDWADYDYWKAQADDAAEGVCDFLTRMVM